LERGLSVIAPLSPPSHMKELKNNGMLFLKVINGITTSQPPTFNVLMDRLLYKIEKRGLRPLFFIYLYTEKIILKNPKKIMVKADYHLYYYICIKNNKK
jgi:hypothetical protein